MSTAQRTLKIDRNLVSSLALVALLLSTVSPSQRVSAGMTNQDWSDFADRACQEAYDSGDLEKARHECRMSLGKGSEKTAELLDTIDRKLRQKYGAEVDAAIERGDGAAARTALKKYQTIPSHRRNLVEDWERKIRPLEAQAAARDSARRAAGVQAALPRLSRRWGFVRSMSMEQFENWVESHTTVAGSAAFDRVEIKGRELWLWTDSSNPYQSDRARFYADISDAFVAWCACDGITHVGYDYSYFGGNERMQSYTVRFNPEIGRSQINMGDIGILRTEGSRPVAPPTRNTYERSDERSERPEDVDLHRQRREIEELKRRPDDGGDYED